VTLGALGSYAAKQNGTLGEKLWHRFSASGELLGTAPVDMTGWTLLYNPQAAAQSLSAEAQGYEVHGDGGYVIWRQPRESGGAAVAAFDYDGTPLSLDTPLTRPLGVLHFIYWDELAHGKLLGLLH
jgi:hypothetical protein